MEEALEVWKKGDTVLEIHQDDRQSPDSREWDNLGIMLCGHGSYTLGDEQFNDRESLDQRLKELDPVIKLPLWLMDHSGLWMQTGEFDSDAQHWDSGQVGWIVATKKDILDKIYPEQRPTPSWSSMIKNAEQILRGEVETYSKDLSGEVYGYVIKKVNTCAKCQNESFDNIDSCWGFYSHDDIWNYVGKKGWVQQ